MWHVGILPKLAATGVSGPAFSWFQDFLSARSQRTVVGASISDALPISAGVPQGGILSSLLFIVYVNDLPAAILKGEANLFADDTSVYVAHKDTQCLQHHLQAAVDEVQLWMFTWLVSVNALKSAVMVFRTPRMARPSISKLVCGDVIKQTSVHRHLGLHLDECLTWSAQVSHVTSKASQRIGLLHRLCHKLSSVIIRAIYLATVQPITDYACLVWGPGLRKGDSTRLERVHRRAARLMSGTKLADNVSHELLLARAGLSPLAEHRQYRLAQFASKLVHGFVPEHLLESTDHWFTPLPEQSQTLRSVVNFGYLT